MPHQCHVFYLTMPVLDLSDQLTRITIKRQMFYGYQPAFFDI